ncbi:MAG TPA: hypothetical protein VEC99_18390, partial [Clostridia bacterium]|nr:hypothetical protein [Clostridia bacterium]
MPVRMGVWGKSPIHTAHLFEWHKPVKLADFLREFIRIFIPSMLSEAGEIQFMPIASINAFWVPEELRQEYEIILNRNDSRGKTLGEILITA